MAERTKFVPLSKIDGQEIAGTVVDLRLPPYVDQDKIKVNPERIKRMSRMGGIRQLKIIGREGETSRFVPTIVGHSSQGEGYAGATVIQEIVPTSRSSRFSGEEYHDMPLPGRWADAQVVVNLSEISDRIHERRPEGGIRSTTEWSRELDKAVRKGIREAGQAHLLANEGDNYFDFALPQMGAGLLEAMFFMDGLPLVLSLGTFLEANLLFNALERVHYLGAKNNGEPHEGFRLSFFPGIQLDRLAALHGMSRVTRVVKEEK